jgi:hypothetical protein
MGSRELDSFACLTKTVAGDPAHRTTASGNEDLSDVATTLSVGFAR